MIKCSSAHKDATLLSLVRYATSLMNVRKGGDIAITPSCNSSYDQHKRRSSTSWSINTLILSIQEHEGSHSFPSSSKKKMPPKNRGSKKEAVCLIRSFRKLRLYTSRQDFREWTRKVLLLIKVSQKYCHICLGSGEIIEKDLPLPPDVQAVVNNNAKKTLRRVQEIGFTQFVEENGNSIMNRNRLTITRHPHIMINALPMTTEPHLHWLNRVYYRGNLC